MTELKITRAAKCMLNNTKRARQGNEMYTIEDLVVATPVASNDGRNAI